MIVRVPFRKIALVSLSLALGFPAPASAFLYIRGGKFKKGARPVSAAPAWEKRTLRFVVNTNTNAYHGTVAPLVSAADFLLAAQLAAKTWAGACRSDLSVEISGSTDAIADANDGVQVISYDNRPAGSNTFGNDVNILAAATTVLSGNLFYDCDIVVNGNAQATFGVDSAQVSSPGSHLYDLVSILAHEMGHCLGLDHPIESDDYDNPPVAPDYDVTGTRAEKETTMLWNSTMVQSAVFGERDVRRRTLNQDDKDGIDCIYERGRPLRTGTRCGSYHGTNGGDAIEGIITGGATEERGDVCGAEGDARTVSGLESESPPGCIGSAGASVAARAGSGESLSFSVLLARALDPVYGILLYAFYRVARLRIRRRKIRAGARA